MTEDGAKDLKAAKYGGGGNGVASDANIEGAIPCLGEAVRRIAMGGEYGDSMAQILQADCCVDYQTFCSAYAEVGVDKDDVFVRYSRSRLGRKLSL